MKHALFVAFHYPPEASSSGVLRTLKYTRYLAEMGWRTTVISPDVGAYSITDPGLETQVPATTHVVRTPFRNTKRHLSIRGIYPAILAVPDVWIGWAPWGIRAGRDVFRTDPFDLVYSTSPHASAHVIAWRIAAATGKPWVTDFRDPWIEDPPEPDAPTGYFYTTLNRWLERRTIERCTAVVTSTVHLRDTLRERYAGEAPEKIQAILNGYDEADFQALPEAAPADPGRMVILHAGGINSAFRDPAPVLRALRSCAQAGRVDLSRVRVRFLGGGPFGESQEIRDTLKSLGLEDVVEFMPRVPYAQSLAALAAADLLLLLQASPDTVGLVPAKLYEYLRSQKPVLALVHPGATDEVFAAVGGGWSVAPENPRAVEDALATAFKQWSEGSLGDKRADLTALRRFDRKALAGELATLFDRVTQR